MTPASEVQLASAQVGFALSGQPTSGFDGGLSSPRGLIIAWPSPSVVATYDGARHWTRSLAIPGGFWGVDVLDPNHVWAVGVKALYRSGDGGGSWQRAGEPPKPLVRVVFTDANRGFGLTVKGRLVQTDDSGNSWVASRWAGRGVAMCASSHRTILVVSQNGGIWRSINEGSSWLQVASAVTYLEPPVGQTTQLSCRGSNAVELSQQAGEYGAAPGFARVRQTTDDGGVWRTIATQLTGPAPTVSRPRSVPNALLEAAAVGTSAACLVGGYELGQRPDIGTACTQPGVTGYRKGIIPELPFAGRSNNVVLQGVDFLNAHSGWLMLDSSIGHNPGGRHGDRARTEILTTHNGGLTWQPAYVSPTYPAVTCAPAQDTICGWHNPLG